MERNHDHGPAVVLEGVLRTDFFFFAEEPDPLIVFLNIGIALTGLVSVS